jgi:NitT/TauT family transport system substrate-binding protein
MKKNFLFLIFTLLLFVSSQIFAKELTISTNSWIGYTPLFYANEKGYLKKLDIKLLTSNTLAQAASVYKEDKADMVTTTQHEYYAIQKSGYSIIPVILFDRSYGADMVLSNKSIAELQKVEKIDVYLKTDSINAQVLEEFINYYHIDKNKLTLINTEPFQLENLKPKKNKNMLIVTFVPYNIALQKKGFIQLASTKETKVIVVVDSLCADRKIVLNDKKRLQKLKSLIDRSILEMQANKKASYQLVKNYLQGMDYEDYLNTLSKIEWINKPSQQFLNRIKDMGYDEKYLLK